MTDSMLFCHSFTLTVYATDFMLILIASLYTAIPRCYNLPAVKF